MLKREVKYTVEQLQARLQAAYDAAGYKPVKPTAKQMASIDTLVNYRYAPVLENTGPYKQFVTAYLEALACEAPNEVTDAAYIIMAHAVTEMRRAYQHQ